MIRKVISCDEYRCLHTIVKRNSYKCVAGSDYSSRIADFLSFMAEVFATSDCL